jgi:hypothetical protein
VTATDQRLVCGESVVSAELDGEAVLLNVDTGLYFGLDAVGTMIWTALSEGSSQEEIIELILSRFDATPEVVRADVTEFLDTLAAKGLVRSGGQ